MRYLLLSYPAVMMIAAGLADEKQITRKNIADALILLDYSFLRTKLYRNRALLKISGILTQQEYYPSLLKIFF